MVDNVTPEGPVEELQHHVRVSGHVLGPALGSADTLLTVVPKPARRRDTGQRPAQRDVTAPTIVPAAEQLVEPAERFGQVTPDNRAGVGVPGDEEPSGARTRRISAAAGTA